MIYIVVPNNWVEGYGEPLFVSFFREEAIGAINYLKTTLHPGSWAVFSLEVGNIMSSPILIHEEDHDE